MKTNFLRKLNHFGIYGVIVVILSGCAWGNQPVIWSKSETIDFNKSVEVNVSSKVEMPKEEIEFIKQDIEEKLKEVFNSESSEKYKLDVLISKYDEGNATARFIFFTAGQMYLYGDVVVSNSSSNQTVKKGEFKKNYKAGGLWGATATMRKNMSSKVSEAIVKALKK